jgi:hypothetical protein
MDGDTQEMKNKPQYKLFEIDWVSEKGPCLMDKCWPSIGRKYGSLRIFGFTDYQDWKPGHHYELTPCDHTGNHKYAIGRLEK